MKKARGAPFSSNTMFGGPPRTDCCGAARREDVQPKLLQSVRSEAAPVTGTQGRPSTITVGAVVAKPITLDRLQFQVRAALRFFGGPPRRQPGT